MPLKGNLIVCQSGGPTAVINASLVGVIEEALCHEEIGGVYGAINGILGILNRSVVDLKKEDPSVIRGLLTTPSAGLGSCRYRPKEEDLERIHDFLREYNIRYFFINGGNDSMDTGMRILKTAAERKYELRVIGIPKTVDNDLLYTDHCPGYGSIGRWLAIATMDAGRDTEGIYTSDPVKIIETMGRDAGWVAATSALAKRTEQDAPHLIYLPEISFSLPEFLDDVQRLYDSQGYAVIVASEGLREKDGRPVIESKRAVDMDNFGHVQPGGIGQYLADVVTTNLKIKARFDKPGTIQRSSMSCASAVDSREAYLAGKMGVLYAAEGKSGFMVTLQRTNSRQYQAETGIVELEKVANQVRAFPTEFVDAGRRFVTQGFLDYATPLVGELPYYQRLKKYPVLKPGLPGKEGSSKRG
jgi:ATP-dependent phosphofructokinase / diphosphate-dependent phosphofructokinase